MADQPARAARALHRARRDRDQVRHAGRRGLEAVQDPVELDPHLVGQSVAGHVIRRLGRAARIFQVVRVILRLEHVEDVRAIGLGRPHDIRAGGIGLAGDREGLGRLVHVDAGLDQGVEEGDDGGHVGLIGGDHIAARVAALRRLQHRLVQAGVDRRAVGARLVLARGGQRLDAGRGGRPAILRAALDAVVAHLPDAQKQTFPVARRVVDDRPVHRPLVVQRVLQMPFARRDRGGAVIARQLELRHQVDGRRGGAADDFGQKADRIVEVGDRPLHAVVPGGIGRGAAGARAGLILGHQAAVHGHADFLQLGHDQRVVVEVERIAERRNEHDHAVRAGLVLVVDDLRVPFAEQLPVDVGRLGHRRHEAVAVVIVADVLVVQARQRAELALLRVLVPHVPVRDHLHAVRIVLAEQDDGVVQHPQGLGIGLRQHPIEHLDLALRGDGLAGVQARVDPDDRLALGGQLAGRVLLDAVGLGQLAGDLLVAVQLGQIGRRRDDGHPHGAALLGLADIDQLHPVRLAGQRLQIGFVGRVVGQEVVAADRLGEGLVGRGDVGGDRAAESAEGQHQAQGRSGHRSATRHFQPRKLWADASARRSSLD